MKNRLAILLLPLLLLAGPVDASGGWFKVINVTPIEMTANSEANFTVSVKGMGGERAYVELVFRNRSEGFDFTCPKMIKNVFPAGVTDYECSVKAGDIAPGNYSFVVDTAAPGARPGRMTAYINVIEQKSQAEAVYDSTIDYLKDMSGADNSEPELSDNSGGASQPTGAEAEAGEAPQQAPMPGAAMAVLSLLVALRSFRMGT
ncbi:MAG: hypothetical protein GX463_11430 [Methanothrix sp.]|nr:hypothetical protein [Methanothrix sp.]